MSTPDIRKALRRRPLWRVEDFATYMGWSHKQALTKLKRYNEALTGLLLRVSEGENRVYTFYWRSLAKHDPDAFLEDPIDQQRRVDELEDVVEEMRSRERIIVTTVGQNSRDIAKMKRTGQGTGRAA